MLILSRRGGERTTDKGCPHMRATLSEQTTGIALTDDDR